MVFHGKISKKLRSYIQILRSEQHLTYQQIADKVHVPASSCYRIANEPIDEVCDGGLKKSHLKRKVAESEKYEVAKASQHTKQFGRPKRLTERDERHLERELLKLQEAGGTFHVPDIMKNAGLTTADSSVRTVTRHLNKKQYGYFQTRKKGLLSQKDLRQRVAFCRKMVKKYPPHFWTHDVAFYLDGVTFAYKTNPADTARSPGSRIWRKRSQGLKRGCTAKGRKEGTGGRYVRLIVGISHGKGVVVCEPYEKMTGEYFASFIRKTFENIFDDADKDSRVWIQDGDPSQNSKAAVSAMKEIKAELLSIPPRSPDLNPIENMFHLLHKELNKKALQQEIQKETFEQFEKRVIDTLFSIPIEYINKTIESMDKRLHEIIKEKGCRIKY